MNNVTAELEVFKGNIEFEREYQIEMLEEGSPIKGISLESIHKTARYGFLDDVWDSDGDSIIAKAECKFHCDGEAHVRATFARGTDPQYVARVLRKYAVMLDGPDGLNITNMDPARDKLNNAVRMEDGTVYVYNHREEMDRCEQEHQDDEGNNDHSPLDE
jgi:hypothetical protein